MTNEIRVGVVGDKGSEIALLIMLIIQDFNSFRVERAGWGCWYKMNCLQRQMDMQSIESSQNEKRKGDIMKNSWEEINHNLKNDTCKSAVKVI